MAVILFGILISALFGVSLFNRFSLSPVLSINPNWGIYNAVGTYSSGSSAVKAQDVQRINIDWVAGGVRIKPVSGSEIVFNETTNSVLTDESEKLHWRMDGDTLRIEYCAPGFRIGSWSTLNKGKMLTVEIPESLYLELINIDCVSAELEIGELSADKLDIEQVSGCITISGGKYESIDLESISGRVDLNDVSAGKIDLDMVSGSSTLSGEYLQIISESISGGIEVETSILPESVRINTVSGKMALTIPENDGFSARFELVSGRVDSDFAMTSSSRERDYKDGGPVYRFESISGSVSLRKG